MTAEVPRRRGAHERGASTLRLVWVYPDLLSTYGDRGNLLVLQRRARLREVVSVAGRYTRLARRGRQVRLLLAKNPAGWLGAFDVLEPPPGPVLLAVNAQVPDGKDTSWLWDVDYRVLRGRRVFVSGERRLDLAVRLEADLVAFDLVDGVDEAVDQVEGTSLDVIANYTAFQQIRVALGRAD